MKHEIESVGNLKELLNMLISVLVRWTPVMIEKLETLKNNIELKRICKSWFFNHKKDSLSNEKKNEL